MPLAYHQLVSEAVTVVETSLFIRESGKLMTAEERDQLIGYLAEKPSVGVLIPSTGGFRKLRWAAQGRGKRGGLRVTYYYHSQEMPLILLKAYSKSATENISKHEENTLRSLGEASVEQYLRRTRR